MAILVFIWIILIFAGMKKSKGAMAFSKENAIPLRGICAVEIMLGHLGIATEAIVLFPNRKVIVLRAKNSIWIIF